MTAELSICTVSPALMHEWVATPDEYDLAAAASAFHWVEEDAGLAKLRGALRLGGWIALWWTSFGDELQPDPFSRALDPLFEDIPHGPSGPSEGRPPFARDAEFRLQSGQRAENLA